MHVEGRFWYPAPCFLGEYARRAARCGRRNRMARKARLAGLDVVLADGTSSAGRNEHNDSWCTHAQVLARDHHWAVRAATRSLGVRDSRSRSSALSVRVLHAEPVFVLGHSMACIGGSYGDDSSDFEPGSAHTVRAGGRRRVYTTLARSSHQMFNSRMDVMMLDLVKLNQYVISLTERSCIGRWHWWLIV
ncbi:hypothetical protein C8R44DRAFT_747003 [Mycena epipterygia]|nr:hypothetical protein C8R44DRAFT_747003 [Mycena epipterygia]